VYYVVNRQLSVVCYRVADMPTPKVASDQLQCAGCHEAIWVAKNSPVAPPKICIQCVQSNGEIAQVSH